MLAAPPAITKVEPPDWVAEPNGITLRMLVTGTDLAGASIRAPFRVSSIRIGQDGTHVFFDLQVSAKVAGRYPIKLITACRHLRLRAISAAVDTTERCSENYVF